MSDDGPEIEEIQEGDSDKSDNSEAIREVLKKHPIKKDLKKAQQNMNLIHYYEDVTAPKKDADGKYQEDTEPGVSEMYQLVSLLCGGLGYLTHDKNFAWLCVVFFFCSVINFHFVHMWQ